MIRTISVGARGWACGVCQPGAGFSTPVPGRACRGGGGQLVTVRGGPVAVSRSRVQGSAQGQWADEVDDEASARGGEPCWGRDDLPQQRCQRARPGPAAVDAARARLWAMTANCSQAAFAVNFPDGRCASGPALSSAMTCSTIACPRWNRSASIAVRVMLVMKAWCRQVSNRVCCPSAVFSPSRSHSSDDEPAGDLLALGAGHERGEGGFGTSALLIHFPLSPS